MYTCVTVSTPDPVPSPEKSKVLPGQGSRAELRSLGNAADQRQVDVRQDRLVFTSEPFRSGLEVTGPQNDGRSGGCWLW